MRVDRKHTYWLGQAIFLMLAVTNMASLRSSMFCRLIGKFDIFLGYTDGSYSQKVIDELYNY